MKSSLRFGLTAVVCLCLAQGLVSCRRSPHPTPENASPTSDTSGPTAVVQSHVPAATNAGPETAAPAAPAATNPQPAVAGGTSTTPPVPTPPPAPGAAPTPGDTSSKPADGKGAGTEDIQISFQGANVDMIVQWLAQTTGKSVVKHPRVQCQLTIVSSRKVTPREAIDLVYRALALEGCNVVESTKSILILPEGQDAKLSPEVLEAARADIPEGRQRLLKVFPITHMPAGELRDKVRGILSEKGTAEVDERANTLIVTDLNENLRLLAGLIRELDVTSLGDSIIEIFPLKHGEAEELANLAGMILNSQSSGTSGSTRSSSSPGGGPPSPGSSPMPMPTPMPSPSPSASGTQGSPQQVRLWPDKAANRLVVSTPKSRLADVRKLIEMLDTSKPADVTVRVMPLKNVRAPDLAKELAPLYQKAGGRSVKETVEIAANERSNSLIILSSEVNYQAISQLVQSLDTEEALEKIVRTFPLKNADAQDVAKQLQQLSQEQEGSSRYPYYIFSSMATGSSGPKKPSVVADRRRNAIVVQAPPGQMESLARMIQELDEPIRDDSLAPRIFALKYVSAADIEDVLNELFLKKQQARSYWDYYDDAPPTTTDRDVGRLYGKVRFTSEPYSNTIIVTSNSKENLGVVEEVLKQLDVPSQAGENTLRLQLRFAKAPTLANHLNILFAKNGSPALRQTAQQGQQNAPQQQPPTTSPNLAETSYELGQETKEEGYYPWLGGQPDSPRSSDGRASSRQVSDLVGRVRVVADPRSNALLISANIHLFPQITKLIEDLDAPTAQVLIEARIVEVSSDAMDKLGVRWSPDGSKVFTSDDYDNSILGNANGRNLVGFGGRTAVNTPLGDLPTTISDLRSGVLDSTVNLDVLIQFLRKNTDATVLAEPQINIADNEMGRLFVGQQVPFIDKSQTTDVGALNQSFQYKSVGIILEVTPHINATGDVALRIRAESSAIQPGQTLFGGAILDTRNFRTEVTARTGQILVLGGIIQKQMSETIRKIPLLGDIPGLGWAFKKKDKTSHDVELMVFLRPRITRTPEEARALLEEVDRRAPLLKQWKDKYAPAETPETGSPSDAKKADKQ